MLQESALTLPVSEKSIPRKKSRRGRPRKKFDSEALLPFKKHEIATDKQFEEIEKKTKAKEPVRRKQRTNPTTSDRNYSADEVEFMNALEEFKRASGRVFPTCSEILGVLQSIGYEKISRE